MEKKWKNLPPDVQNQNGEPDDELEMFWHGWSVTKQLFSHKKQARSFLHKTKIWVLFFRIQQGCEKELKFDEKHERDRESNNR